MLQKNKIKTRIKKVIKSCPTHVTILRENKNEFGEPMSPFVVCEIVGFWHDGNTMITQITTDGGKIKRDKQYFLMLVYDQISALIKEGDYFVLNDKKYSIANLGNCNNMNIYFDMLLKEC
ncbi:Uncharacterised protein [[Clostridium] sordellii]|uniref:hypothetical protein n=1 Tax=Paraclostridium sordellii TaxID=1505 RepID=UPI0005E74C90|nr:hypothetical protein [Paeniclostridium sordellii]CEO04853.1 Uncharacterised protein [[Clostridium] sordellii] [Paeniclostridium sordellii]